MKESPIKTGLMGERFGRTKKPIAPEISEVQQKRLNPKPLNVSSYYCQALIHRAHVVMLTEQEILTKEEGSKILKGIKEVEEEAKENHNLTSYMSTETALIERIGDIGGKMHIARSRNDLTHTQMRLFYRDQIERLIEAIINFRKAILRKAEENLDTVMPGYTHWRQAQPVTLGHYLMAHVDAAERSINRLEDIYKRTNLNSLGSSALAGTGWPIDRVRTMELLGFNELCENSFDCVATLDYIIEFASAIAIHMTNLSRLAEDLQIWSSDEFAMIDLDEAYSGTSSIMPQKKNPFPLEMVKSYSAESLGALVTCISSIKGVSYTNIRDRAGIEPVTIDVAISSTKIMGGVVLTLTPKKETMMAKLANGFSTMTDLSDTLVRKYGLSFRQAHEIIARTTSRALSEGKTAEEITVKDIEESSLERTGRRIGISEESIRSAIDPVENVRRRKVIGGPAPEEVKRMIDDRWKKVDIEESRHKQRLKKLEKAYKELIRAERKII